MPHRCSSNLRRAASRPAGSLLTARPGARCPDSGCKDCAGRAGPATLHDPPLIFDLAADPAEAHNLPPHDARRAPAVAAAAAALADLRRSVAEDATSAVDWGEAPVARLVMCCDETDQLCRCPAPRRFRYADALVPRRGAADVPRTGADALRAHLRRLAHNRSASPSGGRGALELETLAPAAIGEPLALLSRSDRGDWKPDWSLGGARRYLPAGCW